MELVSLVKRHLYYPILAVENTFGSGGRGSCRAFLFAVRKVYRNRNIDSM